jgi:hypothetical protein
MTDWPAELERDGYTLFRTVFDADDTQGILAQLGLVLREHSADLAVLAVAGGPPYGARDLLRLWPGVTGLIRESVLAAALGRVLGDQSGLVRGLYFDKPPGHSWALPWHKDYNVAVAEHRSFDVFTKPTKKAGVPHVEAPVELLERMVTLRIHLDDMTDDNGPLRVIPGSHLSLQEGSDEAREPVTIHCRAGDVLLMRPLLTHASGHCSPTTARHRRIVHLECAPSPVPPDGYEWHDFVRLV